MCTITVFTKNVKVYYFHKCQKKVSLSVKCVCTKEPKTQDSSSIQLKEWVYSPEMFATDLIFSWDSGLIILCTLHDGVCVNSWNNNYQITINGRLLLFTVETVHYTCRNHGWISHRLSTNGFFNGNYQIPIHFSNNAFLQNLHVSVYPPLHKSVNGTFHLFWLTPVNQNILGYSLCCNRSPDGVSLWDNFGRRNLSDKWSSRTKNTRKATNFVLPLFTGTVQLRDKQPTDTQHTHTFSVLTQNRWLVWERVFETSFCFCDVLFNASFFSLCFPYPG